MLPLRYPTPDRWTAVVVAGLDLFLKDHAANERKVSASALRLAVHYPGRTALVEAMVDLAREELDHFKRVNDQLGHQVGDRVLTAVAQCIEEQLRSLDRVGRNGGEEFLVLLPDTRLDEAAEVAERIRLAVSRLAIEGVPADHPIRISIGCAQYKPEDDNLGELVRRADEAMYEAKLVGRNRVVKAA